MRPVDVVSQADIAAGLAALGVSGRLLFVHASLRAFGWVEGGAEAAVAGALRAVGPAGTLAVPVFHEFFLRGPRQVWDRDRSPSRMGRFSERVRTWPGASRSAHPTHPGAAVGPLAVARAARESGSAFGPVGPMRGLVDLDALVALIGVDY